jgi:hypothetical protein
MCVSKGRPTRGERVWVQGVVLDVVEGRALVLLPSPESRAEATIVGSADVWLPLDGLEWEPLPSAQSASDKQRSST